MDFWVGLPITAGMKECSVLRPPHDNCIPKLSDNMSITWLFLVIYSGSTRKHHEASRDVIVIPLTAGVLALIGMLLPPVVGIVLMSLSTIIVAINAQLLRLTQYLKPTENVCIRSINGIGSSGGARIFTLFDSHPQICWLADAPYRPTSPKRSPRCSIPPHRMTSSSPRTISNQQARLPMSLLQRQTYWSELVAALRACLGLS